jgi:hypothetical protein
MKSCGFVKPGIQSRESPARCTSVLAPWFEHCKHGLRLNTETIVNSVPKSLLAAQISLRRPNTDMPEQKLNLLQLAAGFVAEPCTSPPLMPHAA